MVRERESLFRVLNYEPSCEQTCGEQCDPSTATRTKNGRIRYKLLNLFSSRQKAKKRMLSEFIYFVVHLFDMFSRFSSPLPPQISLQILRLSFFFGFTSLHCRLHGIYNHCRCEQFDLLEQTLAIRHSHNRRY